MAASVLIRDASDATATPSQSAVPEEGDPGHPAVVPAGRPVFALKSWLWLLRSVAVLISLAILGSGIYVTRATYRTETAAAQREARLTVDALTRHTSQLLTHAAALLDGMCWVYEHTGSPEETERYVDGLGFDRLAIGNLYLLGAQGTILIAHSVLARGRDVNDREYFQFHRTNPTDRPFISGVDQGRVTGDYYFRLSRRLDNPDGSFAGVVLASINPRSFASYFSELQSDAEGTAALLGTRDHRLRARFPEPSPEKWDEPIDSPLWAALAHSPTGTYATASAVDGVRRLYTYRQVPDLPLVLVVGFSAQDVERRVVARIGWLWPVATVIIALCLTLIAMAASVLRARERLAVSHRTLHEMYLRVRELAWFDPLTALPTRALFTDRLNQCLLIAAREGIACALLYLDLDGFKAVNDCAGHVAGDEVLRVVAQRMLASVRESDTVCRWGGDEFLILLADPGSSRRLLGVVERLRQRIAEPITLPAGCHQVSASIGIARFPADGATAATLQAAADAAMYEAKRQGKGRTVLAADLTPGSLAQGRGGLGQTASEVR
ncbi:MAG: diguanylate cyclase domain-containing protein [Azonexus sp.]